MIAKLENSEVTRQHQIKVFRPNSKQADYTIRSVAPESGCKALQERLGDRVARRAREAFNSLESLGADSLVFRENGRKIKVEAAHA